MMTKEELLKQVQEALDLEDSDLYETYDVMTGEGKTAYTVRMPKGQPIKFIDWSDNSLIASGGICAPVTVQYDIGVTDASINRGTDCSSTTNE